MAWQRTGSLFGNVITKSQTSEHDATTAPGQTFHAIENNTKKRLIAWAQNTHATPERATRSAMTGRAANRIPG